MVAEDGRVHAELGHGPDLGLTLIQVEDRRPLEAVAGVEVNDARRTRALTRDEIREPLDATDATFRRAIRIEAEIAIGESRAEDVRHETRVEVGRVEDGETDVLSLDRGIRSVHDG